MNRWSLAGVVSPMRALLAWVVGVVTGLPAPGPQPQVVDPVGRFPLVLHVAQVEGRPVADPATVAGWTALANAHFAPAGIELTAETRPLDARFARLERIRDRHAFKRMLVPDRINVFVVDEMLDPVASAATQRAAARAGFTPSGRLAGAHIEAPGHTPHTYIILSARDGARLSLTHELGHFFGVAHHRDPRNIMSYGAARERFDARQIEVFRRVGRRLRPMLR